MANLLAQADKKLHGGMMSMFTGIDYDGAGELYEQAANRFKLEKDWDRAAFAFEQRAFCYQKSGSSRNFVASAYQAAGDCVKKGREGASGAAGAVRAAMPAYEKAIAIYKDEGSWQKIGKLLLSCAEGMEGGQIGQSKFWADCPHRTGTTGRELERKAWYKFFTSHSII